MPPLRVNKTEPTLALKPRADITRNPKTGVPVAPTYFIFKNVGNDNIDIWKSNSHNELIISFVAFFIPVSVWREVMDELDQHFKLKNILIFHDS